jgi:ATP-binding cassette subfamily F protein 3
MQTLRYDYYLESHSFSEHVRFREIGKLSPGERLRLLFLYFSLLDVNVLILDEPTNHINFRHIPVIAEALRKYEGAMILVSHVQTFLDQVGINDELDLSK